MNIEMNVTYGQGFLPTLPMFANMGLAKIDVTPDKPETGTGEFR